MILIRMIVSALTSLTLTSAALADESLVNFDSPRNLGRGGSFTAAPYSFEAPRLNPAALAEVKKSTIEFRWFQLDLMAGENSLDTVSDLVDAMGSSGSDSLNQILDTFDDKFGKRQFVAAQLFPLGFRWNSFVIEPFMTNRNYLEMRIPTLPELSLMSDSRAGTNISYAAMLGKSLELGITVRSFFRYFASGHIAATDVLQVATASSSESSEYLYSGDGLYVATDFGAIWAISPGFRLGLVINDVGDTACREQSPTRPPIIQSRVSTGAFWRKNFAGNWHFDSSAELQDVLNRNGYDPIRMLHAGIEVGRNYRTTDNDIGIQAGINDGWLSLGGFVDVWFARIAVANYGIEAGHSPGQRQDRRWAMTMLSSLSF
jgi:hypothetical protein